MKNYKMPIGNPTLVLGNEDMLFNILKDNTNFSFLEVDVTNNIKAPILLHKVNNKIK